MSTPSVAQPTATVLIARVHGLKSVRPRRRIPVKITPYELRVAPAARCHGTRRYGDAEAVVTLATTTSGSGAPQWMQRAADRIEAAAVTSVEAARAIVSEAYAARFRRVYAARFRRGGPRVSRAAEALVADPGWTGDTPISPEETLRQAGIGDTRQAAYQRKLSALLAGRQEAEA